MQRYRINYNWLIGFFVVSFVLAVTSYFVWSWQVERKAGTFIAKAEEALAEDDYQEAFRSYYRYIQLRPEEEDARIKMAENAVEVMKSTDPTLTIEQRHDAYRMLDQTVRRTNDSGLRRELAKIVGPIEAIGHLEDLLEENPQDSELNGLLVRKLFQAKKYDRVKELAFKLIGYNKKTEEFEPEKATIEGETDIYALLSDVLSQRDGNLDLARRVIDQMVEANPESAQAHLKKSLFLSGLKEYDEAAASLDKAYALDSADARILSRKAIVELSNPNYNSSKADYLESLSNFEEAVEEIDDSATESVDFQAVNSALESAIDKAENSKPSFEESKIALEAALTAMDEVTEQLSAAVAPKLDSADELDRTNFEEAKADLATSRTEFGESQSNPEKAKEYAAQGLDEHSDNVLFYKLMAQTLQRLGKPDEAIELLDKGITNFDKNRSIELIIYKIDLLLPTEDYDRVEEEIKELAKVNRPDIQAIIDFQKARVHFRKQEWAQASKQLERIRPELFNFPQYQVMAGTMLGISYESQGINDLAIGAYDSVLQDYPEHPAALAGKRRVENKIGQSQGEGVQLDAIVNKTLELPEDEQDWSAVDELLNEVIEKNNLSLAKQKLLRSKILIKRGRYEEAKQLIRDASKADKDDIDVQYTAILLYMSDPSEGPTAAMKLLDLLEKKFGRSMRSIFQRADLIVRLNAEDASDQLRALVAAARNLEGENAPNENDMLRLYKVLGLKFEQLGNIEESREFYQLAAEKEPNNLPLRMHLFDLAVREGDDEKMKEAQQAVLDFTKSKTDPSYLLTEVKRRLMSFGRGEIDREELAKARDLLDTALQTRPEWHELHVAYGQLLLLLGQELDLALQYFNDALEYGPAKSNAVAIQVKLLYERGLFKQALDRMTLLRKDIRGRVLGKLEAEIQLKNGNTEAAFEAAETLAAGQPKNAATQLWFSTIAQQTDNFDAAIEALRTSLEIKPSDPDGWIRLIGLHIEQKRFGEVESIIREAHLACDPEYLPMLTAKYYELLSRWQNAEAIYLASYEGEFDNLAISRRMADFYLLWSKKNEANVGKAAVHINRILRAANEGKAAADNPHVVWARQSAARILYAAQDYQKSLKAERLLRDSAVNDQMSASESELLVDILVSRNDPQSLLEAKQLLLQLRQQERLSKKTALQLVSILSKTGESDVAKSLLRDQLRKYPEDIQIRATYIDLLIENADYSQAERSIGRLADIAPENPSLVQLSARLAAEQGDQAELLRLLNSIVPKKRGAMNEEQLNQLFTVAQLANRFGAYDLAEELFTIVAQRAPSKTYDLAKFHAYHGDAGKAVELMKRLFEDRMDDVVQLANRMLSARRDEVGDQYDEAVDRLIDESLRDDPDSVTRQLARAEAYETQGKHEESIATYDKILKRDDLPTQFRAMAMNNLGFQLGLLNQRVDEAEQFVNDAIETFGPVADMLDTRAIVRIAQQKYDLAIEDMKLALSVSNDPVKYFHLAKAYILAGDGQAALQAWEQAKKFGFEKEALPKLERPTFEKILQQIESFQTQSAKL